MTTGDLRFLKGNASRWLVGLNVLLALVYFVILVGWFPQGNQVIFWLLVAGEVFHLWQILGFAYTVWGRPRRHHHDESFRPAVDVFITVCGEPVDVVERTARAALAMRYPASKLNVYLLNDGKVAGKRNWREIDSLAKRLKIRCITRETPGGAKAGNVNNGVRQTKAPFYVILDADHVPHEDFLTKTMPYLADPGVAFVQTPQFYGNYRKNLVTGSAWAQQELFFGAICRGKDARGAAFMCGTNMVLRRTALDEVGGLCETNIAEDFVTSLLLHRRGWQSVYRPEVLAEGLAPEDFGSYYRQQLRWARGSLEVLFKFNPLFGRGLSFSQRIEYLGAAGFWLSGTVVLLNALLPLIFFYTGAIPLVVSTMALAAAFLPYMIVTLYVLQRTTNYTYTFRALAFSLAAFPIHLRALYGVVLGRKASFQVTAKRAERGNFIPLIIPHLIYLGLVIAGVVVALNRGTGAAAFAANVSWAVVYVAIFTPFVFAALPRRTAHRATQPSQKTKEA
jgi:cellulose synthase (UDP-forming)